MQSRRAVLQEAIEAAGGEYLKDATGTAEDEAYNQAVSHVIAAIGALLEGAVDDEPRLLPTGNCWCCGCEIGFGRFFAHGHDKRAESALISVMYKGSVPYFLHVHGYGPQRSVTGDAVEKTDWTECNACTTQPGYRGAPAGIAKHRRNHHTKES